MIIYLGRRLPGASCDLTRERDGPPHCSPIRSCSWWGLPSRTVARPLVRSYRTVPSLPHPLPGTGGLHFCGTILGVAPTGNYPAPCPVEPGLSSGATFRPGARDHLICSLNIKFQSCMLLHYIIFSTVTQIGQKTPFVSSQCGPFPLYGTLSNSLVSFFVSSVESRADSVAQRIDLSHMNCHAPFSWPANPLVLDGKHCSTLARRVLR